MGDGTPRLVLCLHEAGTAGEVWRPLASALGSFAAVLAPDRPGWGTAEVPEGYSRTTVHEQTTFARDRLGDVGDVGAVVCGSGIGAVVALDLLLSFPEAVTGAVLVEPPLLAFVPEATEQLAADAGRVRELVAGGDREAALDAYLAGELPALGPGAGRIPHDMAERGARAAASLFAEIAAVPAWESPSADLQASARPALIAVADDAPAFLARAADRLGAVLGRSEVRLTGPGLPHVANPQAIAELVLEISESR